MFSQMSDRQKLVLLEGSGLGFLGLDRAYFGKNHQKSSGTRRKIAAGLDIAVFIAFILFQLISLFMTVRETFVPCIKEHYENTVKDENSMCYQYAKALNKHTIGAPRTSMDFMHYYWVIVVLSGLVILFMGTFDYLKVIGGTILNSHTNPFTGEKMANKRSTRLLALFVLIANLAVFATVIYAFYLFVWFSLFQLSNHGFIDTE